MAENVEIPPLWCSARLNLAILAMLGSICFYSLRVNLSFSIVCMVNHTAIAPADSNSSSSNTIREDSSDTVSSCGQRAGNTSVSYEDGELLWDKEQQGLALGSLFWGYMLTNIAAGIIATHYGGKRVIGGALFCAALLTATTPVAARSSVYAVMAVRILIGICLGCISPALYRLWAQWAPPLESSKLRSFCFAGCQLGYVLTFPVTALLCEYGFDGGWPSVFYIMAGLVLVWCTAWMLLVTDSPVDHPRISKEEKLYIVSSLEGTVSMEKNTQRKIPWGAALRSGPVWACFVCHTCCNWGEYTFLTNIPTYMREVLHFDIKANGLLSSLPYICFWLVINVSGQIADIIRCRQLLGTTQTRKLFNTIGSLTPACLLVGVAFLDCSHAAVAVVLLTLGVALTGCLYGAGLYISFADLSPRHAGVLYGISNTIATIPGFVAPIVIGIITKNQTQEEWRWVFFLAALIFVIGCIVFLVFGSGDVQPWAMEADTVTVGCDGEISQSMLPKTDTDLNKMTDTDAYSVNGGDSICLKNGDVGSSVNPLMLAPPSAQLRGGRWEHKRVMEKDCDEPSDAKLTEL